VLRRLAAKFPSSPQDRAWLVVQAWRQLARGDLELIEPSDSPDWVAKTEPQLEQDFGPAGLRLARRAGDAAGLSSTALGIVPTAQAVDGNEPVADDAEAVDVDAVLAAFARHRVRHETLEPAWAQLLRALGPRTNDTAATAHALLTARAVPAALLALAHEKQDVKEVPVPRVLSARATSATRKVAAHALCDAPPGLLRVRTTAHAISVHFVPLGTMEELPELSRGEVLRLSPDGARALSVDVNLIEEAADALPPHKNTQETLQWR